MSSSVSSPDTITNSTVSPVSLQDDIIHPLLHNSDISEDKSLIYIRNISIQIDQLFLAIKDLHDKMNKLQEEKEAPTGCGFSCSNNSLKL